MPIILELKVYSQGEALTLSVLVHFNHIPNWSEVFLIISFSYARKCII